MELGDVELLLAELLLVWTSTMAAAELDMGVDVAELDSACDVGLVVVAATAVVVLALDPSKLEMKLSKESEIEVRVVVAAAAAADEEGAVSTAAEDVEVCFSVLTVEVGVSVLLVEVCFSDSVVVESVPAVVEPAVVVADAAAGVLLSTLSTIERVDVEAPGTYGAVPTIVCVTPLASQKGSQEQR